MADIVFNQANNPVSLVDNTTGDAVTVTNNRLDVNAEINASSSTIEGKRFQTTSTVQEKVGAAQGAVMLLRNPSGSGKNVILDRVVYISVDQGVNLLYRSYRNPTVTSTGTALTISNSFIDGTGGGIAEVYRDPTISANGTLLEVTQVRDSMEIDDIAGKVVLPPGKDLLYTLESSGNNKKWALDLGWIEEVE